MRPGAGFAAVALLTAGCGQPSPVPNPDQAVPRDLAAVIDLAAAIDLATPIDFAASGDFARSLPDGSVAHRYVIRQIVTPGDHTMFAIDLNGDGRADNHLGDLLSALAGENIDSQAAVDQAVAMGQSLDLVELDTVDDALQNDPAATAGLQAAQAMANPDFSGAGSFSIDFGQAPGVFEGALQAGRLSSENPVLTTQPVTWTLSLALFPGAAPIALTLHGAHLQFQTGTDAASGAPGLLAGQINGSISNADVQTKVIPGVAQSLTSYVQQHPGTPDTMTIEGIFDTGGCTDANGVMAKPNDLMITTCEIAGNLLITNVLSPDVQIFDAQGNYAPNKTNTMKDSFSVGVGFLAVQASW